MHYDMSFFVSTDYRQQDATRFNIDSGTLNYFFQGTHSISYKLKGLLPESNMSLA